MHSPLVDYFSSLSIEETSEGVNSALVNVLWGGNIDHGKPISHLRSYFEYYTDQVTAPTAAAGHHTGSQLRTISTHGELYNLLRLLRSHPDHPRSTIKTLAQPQQPLNEETPVDLDASLDLAARIITMISCSVPRRNEFNTGLIIKHVWKDTESLQEFVNRALPRNYIDPSDRSERIRIRNLMSKNLQDNANFKILWTNNLSDHLLVDVKGDSRSIRIFNMMCFLEVNFQALANDIDLSTSDSLKRGCLPPKFIFETIRTYDLLFPENDNQSQALLSKCIQDNNLDRRLRDFHRFLFKETTSPAYVHDLFEQFPYWGQRLYTIIQEMEDPAPIKWHEKWSERKKGPRHIFWVSTVAIFLALLFGIAATLLGALQVWISYCSWKGQGRICKNA